MTPERVSCFGAHDWTDPDPRGRRTCRRCGDRRPYEWEWWAREPQLPLGES